METLKLIEIRIGRWLAYADRCINAEEPLPRCQPFWSFLAILAAVICLVVVATVVVIVIRERQRTTRAQGAAKYRKVSRDAGSGA